VSSFLTALQHNVGYLVPCLGLERYWYWDIGYWAIFTGIG